MKASFIPSISLVNMNKVAGSTDRRSKQEVAPRSGSRARMSPVQLQWSAERAAQRGEVGTEGTSPSAQRSRLVLKLKLHLRNTATKAKK